MTNDQCKLIAERLCGYQVQVSPAGKYYIVTDEGTKPLPDFEVDAAETLSTVEALCKSRGWHINTYRADRGYRSLIEGVLGHGNTITAAISQSLLRLAEREQ